MLGMGYCVYTQLSPDGCQPCLPLIHSRAECSLHSIALPSNVISQQGWVQLLMHSAARHQMSFYGRAECSLHSTALHLMSFHSSAECSLHSILLHLMSFHSRAECSLHSIALHSSNVILKVEDKKQQQQKTQQQQNTHTHTHTWKCEICKHCGTMMYLK